MVPGGVVKSVGALMQVLSAVLVVDRVLALEVQCWSYRYTVAYFRRIPLRGCIVCPLLSLFVDSCASLDFIFIFVILRIVCLLLYLLANLILVSVFIFMRSG